MDRAKRAFVILMLGMTLLGVDLAGCGGGANSVAVQVGRTPITRDSVKHWMDVIAGEVSTSSGQPKPSVPAPPEYTACISYKRKYPDAPQSAQAAPPVARLRRECDFEFHKEKLKSLYFLISSRWVEGAARELGISPTYGELRRQIAPLVGRFPNKTVARRFLVGVRGSEADLVARLKVVLLTSKIQRELEDRQKNLAKAERQRALDAFGRSFVRTWRARTSCHSGYVVPICKQLYRPPKLSSTLLPPAVPLTKMTAE
jgi:hypothetical protein